MIRIKILSIILFTLLNELAFSQVEKLPYKYAQTIDLALSTSTNNFSASLSWFHANNILKKIPKLKVGYGLRYTTFVGANKYYTTAPAKFTSTVQNLGTIFSRTIQENIDTITTPTGVTNCLNIGVSIEYAITSRLDAGFNIDVLGFSFGPKQNFNIISSSFDANQSPVQTGSPTRWNVLLTSDNDIGSLNSEFFLRYWISNKFAVRVGYSFLFSEYKTENKLSFDNGRIVNDRYRYKAGMLLLALTFKPFHN